DGKTPGDRNAIGEWNADAAITAHELFRNGDAARARRHAVIRRGAEQPATRRFPDRDDDGVADADLWLWRFAVFFEACVEALARFGEHHRHHVIVDVDQIKPSLGVRDLLFLNIAYGRPCGRQSRAAGNDTGEHTRNGD